MLVAEPGVAVHGNGGSAVVGDKSLVGQVDEFLTPEHRLSAGPVAREQDPLGRLEPVDPLGEDPEQLVAGGGTEFLGSWGLPGIGPGGGRRQ
jgi:hypothetical protein